MAYSFQINTASGGSLTTSLSGYYKLDEASGDRTDVWGGNTLTDNNTVTQDASGKVNQAASFVLANSESLSAASSTPYDITTGDFSIAMWLKFTVTTSNMTPWSKTNAGQTAGHRTLLNNVGAGLIYYADETSAEFKNTTNMSNGAWHFVIITRSNTAIKIWVDNNDETTQITAATSGTNLTNNGNFSLGTIQGVQYYTGSIDEVAFWTKVLSANERTDLWNGGAGQTMVSGAVSQTNLRTMMGMGT